MRFILFNLSPSVRLAGSDHAYILQEKILKDGKEVWNDTYYWYSIRDVITGYINYMAKRTQLDLDKEGIAALLDLLNKMYIRLEKFISEFENTYCNDPIEKNSEDYA